MDREEARVEAFENALDCAAFASRVGAFHEKNDGDFFLEELELHGEQLELERAQFGFVFFLRDGFRLVQIVEAESFLWHNPEKLNLGGR